jgi:hypothetical protein
VVIFAAFQKMGQIDLLVPVTYVLLLGFVGTMMLIDSVKLILERKYDIVWKKNDKSEARLIRLLRRIHKLPCKKYFPKSDITVSIIAPLIVGAMVGILVSVMGVGGGFIMIPAMVYVLRMPSSVVVGTSLFQIIFIAGHVTLLQAISNQSVDIILAFLMIISSVIGAQIGTRVSYKVDTDNLRSFLSLLILGVCIKMLMNMFVAPESLYSLEVLK